MSCSCVAPSRGMNYLDIRAMCCADKVNSGVYKKTFWYCQNAVRYFLHTLDDAVNQRFHITYDMERAPHMDARGLKEYLLNQCNCPKTRICDVMIEIMETEVNNTRDVYKDHDDSLMEYADKFGDVPCHSMTVYNPKNIVASDTMGGWCELDYQEIYEIIDRKQWNEINGDLDDEDRLDTAIEKGVIRHINRYKIVKIDPY